MVEPILAPESFDEWEWIKIRFRYPWMELLVIKKRVQYPQQNDFISIFSLFYLFFFLSNHYKTKAKPFCYLSNMILFTYTFPFFRGLNFYVSVSIWVGLAWGWWLEGDVWKNNTPFSMEQYAETGNQYWRVFMSLLKSWRFLKEFLFIHEAWFDLPSYISLSSILGNNVVFLVCLNGNYITSDRATMKTISQDNIRISLFWIGLVKIFNL